MGYKWKEEDLQRAVLDMAVLVGWRRAHFRPAQTNKGWRTPVEGDGAGFPDLILLKGSRMIVAELKSQNEDPTDDQLDWLSAFQSIPGAETFIWRPNDWETIEKMLRAL